jgi:phosphonate transport system substrate-binding protein
MPLLRWVFACSVVLVFSVAWADTPGKLVVGLISPRSVSETRPNWAPFVELLGEHCSSKMDLRVYDKPDQLVADFNQGQIDIAWMGNVPAIEVVKTGMGSIFAQMVTQDGSYGYRSVLIAHKTSSLASLDGVLKLANTLRFSDGEPKSTSGYLVPAYFAFRKNGIQDAQTIFKVYETGNHQQNLKKVASGAVDVATTNNEELQFFVRDHPQEGAQIKVLWESPLIPQSPMLWRSALAPALKKRVKEFFLEFGAQDPAEKTILYKLNGLSRFRYSSNRQLLPVVNLEMYKEGQAIEKNTTLSREEKDRLSMISMKKYASLELRLRYVFD